MAKNINGIRKRPKQTAADQFNLTDYSKANAQVKKQTPEVLEQKSTELSKQSVKVMREMPVKAKTVADRKEFMGEKARFLDEIGSLGKQLIDFSNKYKELDQKFAKEMNRLENIISILTEKHGMAQTALDEAQRTIADLKAEKGAISEELESEKKMHAEFQEKLGAEQVRILLLEADLEKVKNELAEERKKNSKFAKQQESLQSNSVVEDLVKKAHPILMQGRYDEALELYRKAINVEKAGRNSSWELGSFWYFVYFCDYNSNRFEKALEALNKSIEYRPDFPGNIYLRAKMYQELGRLPEAIEDVNRVLELKPGFCPAKDLLNELQFCL